MLLLIPWQEAAVRIEIQGDEYQEVQHQVLEEIRVQIRDRMARKQEVVAAKATRV